MRFRGLLVFVAGLAVGLVMPAWAQTPDPAENQLVIRSDGFIFLVRGGLRHLVSPIALSDEEINAFAEGEPYLSGLVPVEAMSAAPAGSFTGSPGGVGGSSGSGSAAPTSTRQPTSTPAATSTPSSSSSSGDLFARIKDVTDPVGRDSKLKVTIEGSDGGVCEGKIVYKDDKEQKFDDKKDIKSGECKLELTTNSDAKTGDAVVSIKVKKDGKTAEAEKTIDVKSSKTSSSGSDGDLELEIDDYPSSIKQSETLKFKITTEKDAKCNADIEFKGGETKAASEKKANSSGECELKIDIPSDAKEGKATVTVTVSKDGDESEDEFEIDVKKK